MNGSADHDEIIDRKTSRSICDAVGERLQQSLRPEHSSLPERLRRLIEEMRRQERQQLRR